MVEFAGEFEDGAAGGVPGVRCEELIQRRCAPGVRGMLMARIAVSSSTPGPSAVNRSLSALTTSGAVAGARQRDRTRVRPVLVRGSREWTDVANRPTMRPIVLGTAVQRRRAVA